MRRRHGSARPPALVPPHEVDALGHRQLCRFGLRSRAAGEPPPALVYLLDLRCSAGASLDRLAPTGVVSGLWRVPARRTCSGGE
jgi:hypothetical protein